MFGINYTDKEIFRLTGALPGERLEALLERAEELENAVDIEAHISEALGQYPAEDFLQEPINRLNQLAKRLRGENRAEVTYIIEMLDDIAQCTFNAGEYGKDELHKAKKTLQIAN